MAATNRTALVLSAGGVYGAYQAGVWKAIEDSIEPDIVVGASIGSVNAFLIASGCSARELEDLWLRADELLAVRPKLPRHWWQGVLDGGTIERRLRELCEQFKPRVDVTIVTTAVRGLEATALVGRNPTYRHLLASCAVPLAFDLVKLGGRWHCDGGLLGAAPRWAVPEGIASVIVVNSMPPAPWVVRAGADVLRRLARPGPAAGVEVRTAVVKPDRALGPYHEMLCYRRDRIRRWIDLGYEDGVKLKRFHPEMFCARIER